MAKKSSKTFRFARQIKAMRKGGSFDVQKAGDRTLVIQAAATLRAIGAIDFQIVTHGREDGSFTVVAI